jgi:hypothetical protein
MSLKEKPKKYMFISAIFRITFVVAFFFLVSKTENFWGLISSFLGFIVARNIGVIKLKKITIKKNDSTLGENQNNTAIA